MDENNGNNNQNPSNKIKQIISSIATFLALVKPLMLLLLGSMIISFVVTLFGTIVAWITDINSSENTAQAVYEELEIQDVAELIEIKENDDGEYYLDFIEDIDDKLDKAIENINKGSGKHVVPTDKEFLKEIIKAEAVTKFPNLGGEVPEGTTGFQGAVNLRRITPKRGEDFKSEIGSLVNTGRGETSNIENEEVFDIVDGNDSGYEEVVKVWKEGQELYLNSDAQVYKQAESELKPGSDTGYWEEVYDEKTDRKLKIYEGTCVTYTGTYKSSTNSLTNVKTIYVEVKTDKITGFIKAQNLYEEIEENTTSKIEKRKHLKVSSRDSLETMGDPEVTYRVALSAGHNNKDNLGARNGDLKEEELTIKVAERVEELFEKYSNIEIIQTGSTSDNRGGVKLSQRKALTRAANPDMAISIHFNSSSPGGATGVETIYKVGDGISQQFAEIMTKTLSEEMGLKDRGAGTDKEKCGKSLGIIENAATSGFPSIVTEGGFLNGDPDEKVIRNGGIEKYAQGILKGIEAYINADKSGYSSTLVEDEKVTNSIESRVVRMKYIPKDEYDELVKKDNTEALKVFTIDEENGYKLLTSKWSYENNTIDIIENTAIDFRTSLSKYTMPYEYLLFFYTDTDYKDFSLELAKEVQKTEIVIALQDNITTTQVITTVQEEKKITPSMYQKKHGYEWKQISQATTLSETCNTSIDITYVNSWFVKSYKESSYSEAVLQMGTKDVITIELPGKVFETNSTSTSTPEQVESGKEVYTFYVIEYDEYGQEIQVPKQYEYTYKINQRTIIDTYTISNSYEPGEVTTEGKKTAADSKFISLYQKHSMQARVREQWFFSILEKNEKTANLVDLTKYLMFLATDEKHGVKEFDFEEYSIQSFNSMGGAWCAIWGNGCTRDEFIAMVKAFSPPNVTSSGRSAIECYKKYFIANAENFFDISTKNGMDPRFIFCIGVHESYYGTSNIANTKGNFFGWGAVDWDPMGGAHTFADMSAGIDAVSSGLQNYVTPGTWQYERIQSNGYDPTTIDGIGSLYASDPGWAEKVKKHMTNIFGMTDMSGGAAEQVVNLAKSKLGCPYEWGATGPDKFDCSGLVYWIYKTNLGINVPRQTSDYMKYKGTDKEVSMNELQPGDILLRDGHAAIYIGNNEYIHAPQTGDVVKQVSGAKEDFTYAVRFIKVTQMQKKIVEIAKQKDMLGNKGGYCQAWVADVYAKAGQSWESSCCASTAAKKWVVSTSKDNIPLGAAVYGHSSSGTKCNGIDAGHVGIYVGNGQIASNVGYVKIESISSWTSVYGWKGWGWNGGTDYSK